MFLESVEAENFRNLRGGITCEPGLNVLVGDNGQGKTNWLEAIFLLATTRSFKTNKLNEAISFSEDLGIVRGPVHRTEEVRRELQVALQGNIKILSLNGKRIPANQYIGELHAVLFNADSLEVVRGGPEERRKFLDDAIVSIHPPYIQTVTDFARIIKQKNALLQTLRDQDATTNRAIEALRPWNKQLAEVAERVHRSRVRVVGRLAENIDANIFGKEKVTIRYSSSLEEKGDLNNYSELIKERLELRVVAEMASGYSLIGPHRDDLEIFFDGKDLRKFASSGQQRTALLLLQLASLGVYFSIHDEYPLFLIDDIDAEIDNYRIRQLLEYLNGKTQTIITTSKPAIASELGTSGSINTIVAGNAIND